MITTPAPPPQEYDSMHNWALESLWFEAYEYLAKREKTRSLVLKYLDALDQLRVKYPDG